MEANNKLLTILQSFVDNPERVTCKFDVQNPREVFLECSDFTVCIQERCFSTTYQGLYFRFSESSNEQRAQYTILRAKLVALFSIDAWRFFIKTSLSDTNAEFDIYNENEVCCTFVCRCCEDCMLSDTWVLKCVGVGSYILQVEEYVKLIDKWIKIDISLNVEQAQAFHTIVKSIMDEKIAAVLYDAAKLEHCFAQMYLPAL